MTEPHQTDPLPLAGVVSLAGVNDLQDSLTRGGRTDVLTLLDVQTAEAGAPRFDEADPGRLLPLGVPQVLIVGSQDSAWRIEMTKHYAERARAAGDTVTLEVIEGPNHFNVVDPRGPFPQRVASAVSRILD